MQTLLSQIFKDEGFSKAFWGLITACVIGFAAWLSALYLDVQDVKASQQIKRNEMHYISERVTNLQEDVREIKKDVKSLLYKERK